MDKGSRVIQFTVAASVSIAFVTLGVSSAWPTPVIPKFHLNDTSIKINDQEIGWMLAMSSPGFIAGSLVSRYIVDSVGRRFTVLVSAVPVALGSVIVAASARTWLLYVTRFLWGAGTGMLANSVPMYFAEIADKEIRGMLSLSTRFMFNFGSLLCMGIGPFVSYEVLNYMLLVLPIVYLLSCWWIPESPYYLLRQGRPEAASRELMRIRRYKDEKALEDELERLKTDVRNEMRRSGSIRELFRGPQYRRANVIAAGTKLTQILSGVMAIQQYLGVIMTESSTDMSLATVLIIFGGVKFVVGIMSSVLVDRLGRRPLFLYTFLGNGLSLATVGIYFFCKDILKINTESLKPYGFLTFAGIICSNVLSTLGFASLSTVVPAEIFPLNVKAVALASLSILGGVLSFIVSICYQKLKDISGLFGVFTVFSCISFIGAIFTLVYIPETKGKSLREIQIMLQGDLYEETYDGDVGETKELVSLKKEKPVIP